MKEVITIDDEMHGNRRDGTLEEWNIGRMSFSKNHITNIIPLFHQPLLRYHK
jgi:hypothetical protein